MPSLYLLLSVLYVFGRCFVSSSNYRLWLPLAVICELFSNVNYVCIIHIKRCLFNVIKGIFFHNCFLFIFFYKKKDKYNVMVLPAIEDKDCISNCIQLNVVCSTRISSLSSIWLYLKLTFIDFQLNFMHKWNLVHYYFSASRKQPNIWIDNQGYIMYL